MGGAKRKHGTPFQQASSRIDSQGILRVVRAQHHTFSGGCKRCQRAHHPGSIGKVEIGGGFIENQCLCTLAQCTRYQHQLLLPAGKQIEISLFQFTDAQLFQCMVHRLVVGLCGATEQTPVAWFDPSTRYPTQKTRDCWHGFGVHTPNVAQVPA